MKRILSLIAGLLCMSPALPAQAPFTWTATLGLDYFASSHQSQRDVAADESETFLKRLDLRFSSALWSRRFLLYTLWLNSEEGDITVLDREDSSARLGYGLELHLLPESRNQVRIRYGRDTYDYTYFSGPDYSQKASFLNATATLRGWFLEGGISDSATTGIDEDTRHAEQVQVKKLWSFRKTRYTLEVRHRRNEQDLFRSFNEHQTGRLLSSFDLPGDGNLSTDLTVQHYLFGDEDLSLDWEDTMGMASSLWTQKWTPRWETQQRMRLITAESGESTDINNIVRYRLTWPLRLEASAGYMSNTGGDRDSRFPYFGAGLFYMDTFQGWDVLTNAGLRRMERKRGDRQPSEETYYLSTGLSKQWEKSSLDLMADYNGIKQEADLPDPEQEIWGDYIGVAVTSDNLRCSVNYRQALFAGFRLDSHAVYHTYDYELNNETSTMTTLYGQVNLRYRKGSLGARFASTDREEGGGGSTFESRGVQGSIQLNTHLGFQASYVFRDKQLGEVTEEEEEGTVRLRYAAGKFVLSAWYRTFEAVSEFSYRKYDSYRVTVLRRFGNE